MHGTSKTYSFSFTNYLLNVYYVPDMVLGIGQILVNKTDMIRVLIMLTMVTITASCPFKIHS